jgi:hypothetical protein
MSEAWRSRPDMRRIFLVGCPRSGTTLVQSLLAAGEGVTSFTESHFFDRALPAPPLDRWFVRDARARLEAFRAENGLEDPLPAGVLEGADEDPAAAAGAFAAVLDAAAVARGCDCWVEKTPDHLFRIGAIRRFLPDAEFVHVVRSPGPTVRSLVRASRDWGKPRSAAAFGLKWLICARLTARWRGRPGHHVVFYDDLVAAPEAGARSLYDALGIAWSPAIMSRYREVAQGLVVSNETWKSNNFGAIRPRPVTPDEAADLPLIGRVLRRQYEALHGARG